MRLLIVGLGSVGRRHLMNARRLRPDAEIVVLRRTDGPTPDDLAGTPVVRSLEDAVAARPEAAIVASPATCHVADATVLAKAGVHLLIEKPLADSLEGIDGLLAECRRVHAAVGYNLRFYPPLIRLRDAVHSGAIGRVLSVRAEVGQYLPDWRLGTDYRQGVSARRALGGGAINELSHELDYLRWVCGDVVEVHSVVERLSDLAIDVEDTCEAIVRFASGAVGSVHLDMLQRPMARGLRIIGSLGTIVWDGLNHAVTVWTADTAEWRVLGPPSSLDRNATFVAELNHFFECIDGKEAVRCSVEDGRRVLELALAIKRSARERRAITL